MATYFVRVTGNDTTGDGSTGNPWATLSKAMTIAGAGDTIRVGNGTYAENTSASGAWLLSKNVASTLSIEGENGASSAVLIIGTSGVNNTLTNGVCNNLQFKWLTFGMRASTSYAFRFNTNCTNISFISCVFDASGSTSGIAAIYHGSASAVCSGITFTNCISVASPNAGYTACVTFSPTSTGSIAATFDTCTLTGVGAIYLTGSGASITCTNCTVTGNYPLRATTAGTITLTGGSFVGALGAAININGGTVAIDGVYASTTGANSCVVLGVDGTSGNATTGSIKRSTIVKSTSLVGHSLIIGAGCSGVLVEACVIPQSYDYALVIKECSGTEVRYCTLVAGTGASVGAAAYCKAATGANIHHNKLIASNGATSYCFQLLKGDTGNKSGTVTFADNQVIIRKTALALNWGDSTHDSGGGICNRNRYDVPRNFGNVRTTTAITSLAGLQAAWSGYGGANDQASRRAMVLP